MKVKRYRKKPVVIEAVQFNGNFEEIEIFVGGDAEFRDGKLLVATPEGPVFASPGDYIIKGIKGEFYPCKPDIFEASYEEVPTPEMEKPIEFWSGSRSWPAQDAWNSEVVHVDVVVKSAYDEEMQKKVKLLVEALRFYADEDQYTATDIVDGVEVLEISSDQGERAREALKEWE